MTADRSVTIRLRVSSAEFDAAMARAGTEVGTLRAEVEAAGRAAGGPGAAGLTQFGTAARKSAEEFAAAQRKVQEAQRTVATAADNVRLAEQKLDAARRAAAGVPTEQQALRITAAENALAVALRNHETASGRAGAASQAFDDVLTHLGNSADGNSKKLGGLRTTIELLGPTMVPIAGGAAALVGGFAALGIAGVLAFKGIKQEIKEGTPVGQQYAQGVDLMKNNIDSLEQTAARGVLTGFEDSITSLNGEMPQFNAVMGQSSQVLGDVAGKLASGLVGGFGTFAPVIEKVEGFVEKAAGAFESWATGSGGAEFAQDLGQDLDHLVPALSNLAELATHFISALQPAGNGSLDLITEFSGILNTLPVGVLKAGTTAYIAFRGAVAVTAGIKTATLALQGFAAAEGEAAAAAGAGALAGRTRAFAGSLAVGLARISPYVAAVAGLTIASGAAADTTEKLSTSTNVWKESVGRAGDALNDVTHLHFGALGKDFTSGQAETTRNLKASFEQYQKVNLARRNGLVSLKLENEAQSQYAQASNKANQSLIGAVQTQIKNSGSVSTSAGAYNDATKALQAHIDAQKAFLPVAKDQGVTINGITYATKTVQAVLKQTNGDYAAAAGILAGHTEALDNDTTALQAAQRQQRNISDAVAAAADKYKLTADQVDLYASAVGITADQLALGEIGQAQFTKAIGAAKATIDTGNTSILGYVAAIQQYNSSAGTAADKAALIGETLKAYNGDALAYAGALSQAATTTHGMIQTLQSQTKQVHDGQLAYEDTERAALHFTQTQHGLKASIDTTKAGAAALITQLQGLQTNAMNAASATFQHERATRGAKQAADDAYKVYVNQTKYQLIDQKGRLTDTATALGLNKDEAEALTKKYLNMPKDVKTKIEQLGGDKTQQILGAILQDLDKFTGGHHMTLYADASQVYRVFSTVQNRYGQLVQRTSAGISVGAQGKGPHAMATGGPVFGAGPKGVDSVPILGAPGEFMVTAPAVDQVGLPFLESINRLGGGAITPVGKSVGGYASARPVASSAAAAQIDYRMLALAVARAISNNPIPVAVSGQFRAQGSDLLAVVSSASYGRSG